MDCVICLLQLLTVFVNLPVFFCANIPEPGIPTDSDSFRYVDVYTNTQPHATAGRNVVDQKVQPTWPTFLNPTRNVPSENTYPHGAMYTQNLSSIQSNDVPNMNYPPVMQSQNAQRMYYDPVVQPKNSPNNMNYKPAMQSQNAPNVNYPLAEMKFSECVQYYGRESDIAARTAQPDSNIPRQFMFNTFSVPPVHPPPINRSSSWGGPRPFVRPPLKTSSSWGGPRPVVLPPMKTSSSWGGPRPVVLPPMKTSSSCRGRLHVLPEDPYSLYMNRNFGHVASSAPPMNVPSYMHSRHKDPEILFGSPENLHHRRAQSEPAPGIAYINLSVPRTYSKYERRWSSHPGLIYSSSNPVLSGVEDMTRNPKPIDDQRKTDLVSNEFHLEKGYENILSGVEDMTRNPKPIDDQRKTDLVSNEFHLEKGYENIFCRCKDKLSELETAPISKIRTIFRELDHFENLIGATKEQPEVDGDKRLDDLDSQASLIRLSERFHRIVNGDDAAKRKEAFREISLMKRTKNCKLTKRFLELVTSFFHDKCKLSDEGRQRIKEIHRTLTGEYDKQDTDARMIFVYLWISMIGFVALAYCVLRKATGILVPTGFPPIMRFKRNEVETASEISEVITVLPRTTPCCCGFVLSFSVATSCTVCGVAGYIIRKSSPAKNMRSIKTTPRRSTQSRPRYRNEDYLGISRIV
eukprot:1050172_1